MFSPYFQRPNYTHMQSELNYSSVCFNLQVFRHETRRHKFLYWTVTTIPDFNLFLIS
jgi:hypothetical protein